MTSTQLAINGTLMRGLELNQNMIDAGATFLRESKTAPCYRLWSIGDSYPAMQRADSGGASISLEVWEVPSEGLVSILRQEPPGLCVGRVELDDGESILGVLGERYLCRGQREITEFGGWREYHARSDPGD